MTPAEWRADPEQVKKAVTLLTHPIFQEMLAVMDADPPSNLPLPKMGSSADDKAMALGTEYGYRHFAWKLRSLGMAPKVGKEPEATFAPEP